MTMVKLMKLNLYVFSTFMFMKLNREVVMEKYHYILLLINQSLFEKMLAYEKVKPNKLGYDRPSDKFIKFLSKHYNLNRYVPQNNNFVVFSSYFEVYNIKNIF